MKESRALSSYERRQQLLEWIARSGRISTSEIRKRFGVSEATARRDLEVLAEEGKVMRVHGGAVFVRRAPPEPPLLQREQEQFVEKQRIGRAAAALVQEGETIFLGSGTTTLAVARHLKGRQGLTVITNSLPVMNVLADEPGITLIGIGGLLRPSELSFIGHIAEQALAELRADKVFIGIRALSLEHGLTSDYLPEVLTDRAILRMGREVILVADHTKFGAVSSAFLAPVISVHRIVTDATAPPEMVTALRRLGIEVILA
ncbi:DeoR/GlpR family DNA-binding transcription regulator [Thermoflexus sp.]|uniref:DeoR/GlpR family DNA-binding transcription regulator n=1 Tax=Thermoflexus sp. TaxID=1969742 RepID=UPI0025E98703|nr:DeoR/GlpR family DNA-binding transcription regulator [Thermoflexus sp.]MDW8180281.1 DeoR/GlpR family DNA-binding transcription regulator [Anaerolineae bacterium]MCS6963791.1 DeoR/GlpR family DNA-binding transcription regulator [Thermoflexus sp.]MCS7350830.1 DeoR/GlpR family DNA-binding transcription regulator [Thermoflexus sp.]MCX7690368.1 DeoR/GlpR family DNA-binding transcription regulator [Thermoflexus sp.]MDW8185001.1 DeoR/GlpR family DNA-binding transcription regulator [Anaerolineae ba